MVIRAAAHADLSPLLRLFQDEIELQRRLSKHIEVARDFDLRGFTEAKLDNPNERVFVAEQDGQLLGHIDVRALRSAPTRTAGNRLARLLGRQQAGEAVRAAVVGRIEDCYVEKQFRRQGIGSALLKEGLAWLRTQGVKRVDLAVSAANSDGQAFWQQQGFAPFQLLMSKEVA